MLYLLLCINSTFWHYSLKPEDRHFLPGAKGVYWRRWLNNKNPQTWAKTSNDCNKKPNNSTTKQPTLESIYIEVIMCPNTMMCRLIQCRKTDNIPHTSTDCSWWTQRDRRARLSWLSSFVWQGGCVRSCKQTRCVWAPVMVLESIAIARSILLEGLDGSVGSH